MAARLDLIRDALQTATTVDLGDYLQFIISPAQTELQGAPDGGARFPCVATLASKVYERFHIDLGFGDVVTGTPETLVGDDLLAFAEIARRRYWPFRVSSSLPKSSMLTPWHEESG